MRKPLIAVCCGVLLAACSTTVHGTRTLNVDTLKVVGTTTVSVPQGRSYEPLIAPDGQRVVGLNDGKLCAIDLDGSHSVCTDAKVDVDVRDAAWSPDSTRIAFTEYYFRDFREPDVWVMDVTTGKATDLTDDGVTSGGMKQDPKAQYDFYPSWSADGRSIRFARQVGTTIGRTILIESVPAGGGSVSQLGTISGQLVELAGLVFSPDGKTIAWSAGNSSWSSTTVHIRGVGGGTDHALSDAPVKGDQSLLSFSADGRYLLVDSVITYAQLDFRHSSARVYPAGGGAGQQVAADAIYPTWSPTGHALAFATATSRQTPALRVVAAPGGTPRTITSNGVFGFPDRPRLQWTEAGVFGSANGKSTLLRLA